MGFSCPEMTRFCTMLFELVEEQKIDASRPYNTDETGIQTSTKDHPKVNPQQERNT